ncbi:MAG: hypothetical protein IT365_04290 [Candidatus Hydrogenedentes bacterium]|nr:hypothetical protein [Candidatus Hydrogenedentota bacterium]
MRAPRFIYSKSPSKCCKAKALIVQSRPGGFISQNCLKCGKPAYIQVDDLPECVCDFCEHPLKVEKTDGQNYFYACGRCNRNWKIGDNVPRWDELFEYAPLAAGGQPTVFKMDGLGL